MSFADRYGPWAIVTGAAQGLGAAFATDLTRRGLQVLLVDRDERQLAATAAGLAGSRPLVADLATVTGARAVVDAAADLDIGLLVSNAAVSVVGPFVERTLEQALAELDVNARAPLVLVHALVPRLVARGRGGVLLVSSGSAWRGSPLVSVYAATKAWNLILAESLWDELGPAGVDVMAMVPGSMRTPGWVASMPQPSLGTSTVMEPADEVAWTLD